MKSLYINGVGCISPQPTFDNSSFLPEIKEYSGNRMQCLEPDYSEFFDPAGLRRMSRIMKFGTAAALIALKDAGIKTPGGISTGTGFGLLETSEKFLRSVIESNEGVNSPTAFIQSTHNTVSSNIAIITGCTNHNNTFSQKGFSFESALTDAKMLMNEGDNDNFLVGAYDELTDTLYTLMSRLNLFNSGVIAGEGAGFFVLSKQKTEDSYCRLIDVHTFYKPDDTGYINHEITSFLKTSNIELNEIDIVLSGLCGDKSGIELNQKVFTSQAVIAYKQLCGEFMTSSAFAFWLAAKMLKTQTIPDVAVVENKNRMPGNILIYNSYKNNHSLILLSHA